MADPTPDELARLRGYVSTDATHDAFLSECWVAADELVSSHAGTATVPAGVRARAVLEVASELFHRRNAPAGVLAQYADVGAAPIRIARDPMTPAYPMLAPYLPGGFA